MVLYLVLYELKLETYFLTMYCHVKNVFNRKHIHRHYRQGKILARHVDFFSIWNIYAVNANTHIPTKFDNCFPVLSVL